MKRLEHSSSTPEETESDAGKRQPLMAYRGIVRLQNGEWLPAGILHEDGVITATFDDSEVCVEMGLEGMRMTNLTPAQIVKFQKQSNNLLPVTEDQTPNVIRPTAGPLSLNMIQEGVNMDFDNQYQEVRKNNMLICHYIFPESFASLYFTFFQKYAAFLVLVAILVDIGGVFYDQLVQRSDVSNYISIACHAVHFSVSLTLSVHICVGLLSQFEVLYFQLINILYVIIRTYNEIQEDDASYVIILLVNSFHGYSNAFIFLMDAIPISVLSVRSRKFIWPLVVAIFTLYLCLQFVSIKVNYEVTILGETWNTGDLQTSFFTTIWLFSLRMLYYSIFHSKYMILLSETRLKPLK